MLKLTSKVQQHKVYRKNTKMYLFCIRKGYKKNTSMKETLNRIIKFLKSINFPKLLLI